MKIAKYCGQNLKKEILGTVPGIIAGTVPRISKVTLMTFIRG